MSVLEEQAKQIDTPENVDTTEVFKDTSKFNNNVSPEKVEAESPEEASFLQVMQDNSIAPDQSRKLDPFISDLTLATRPEQIEAANLKARTYATQMQGEIADWSPKYDEGFITGDSVADTRYRNQSGLDLLGSTVVQVMNELTLGTLEGAATIASLGMNLNAFKGEERDFSNGLIQAIRDTKEEISKEYGQVHRPEGAGFDVTDPTFWAENAGNMATSLSLMLPTMGVVKGAGAIGKITGISKQLKQMGKLGRALRNPAVSGALKGIAGAFVSRLAENTMEASEAVNAVKIKLQGRTNPETGVQYTEEEIREIAGQAGQSTWNWNWVMGAIDAVQYGYLFKGMDFARAAAGSAVRSAALTASETAAEQGSKRALGSFFKAKMSPALKALGNNFTVHMVPEGLEEGYQYIVSQESQYRAMHPKEKFSKADLVNRMAGYITDDEFYTSVVLGAVGGGVFGSVRSINNKLQSKKVEQVKQRMQENYDLLSASLASESEFDAAQTEVLVKNSLSLASEGSLDLFESDIDKLAAVSDEDILAGGMKVEEYRRNIDKAREIAEMVGNNFNAASSDSNIQLTSEYTYMKTMEDLALKDYKQMLEQRDTAQAELDQETDPILKNLHTADIDNLNTQIDTLGEAIRNLTETRESLLTEEGTRDFINKMNSSKMSEKTETQTKPDTTSDAVDTNQATSETEVEVTADDILNQPTQETKQTDQQTGQQVDPTEDVEVEEEDTGDTANEGSGQEVVSDEPQIVYEEPEVKRDGIIYYNGKFDTKYVDIESKRQAMADKGVGLIPDSYKRGSFVPISNGSGVILKTATNTWNVIVGEDGKIRAKVGVMSTEITSTDMISHVIINGKQIPVDTLFRVEQSDDVTEVTPTEAEAEIEEVPENEKGTQTDVSDATEDSLEESENTLVDQEQSEVTSEEEATTTPEQVPQNKLETEQNVSEEKEKEPTKVNELTDYDFSELSDLRTVNLEFSNYVTERGSRGKYRFEGLPKPNRSEAYPIDYDFAETPMEDGEEGVQVKFIHSTVTNNGKVFDVVLVVTDDNKVISKLAASGKTMRGNLQVDPFNELVKLLKDGREIRGVVKDKVASLRGSLGTVKDRAFKLSEYRDVNLPEGKVMIGGVYKSTDNRITLYDSEGNSRSIPIKEQTLQPGVTYMAVKHPNGSTKLIPLKETQFSKSDAESFLASFQELADKFNEQLSKELESATSDAERADIIEKFKNTNLSTRDSIANSELRDLVEKTGLRTKHAVKSDTGYSYTAEHFVPRFQLIDGKVTPTIETAYTDAQGNIKKRTNKDFNQMRSKVNGKYRSIKHEQLVNTDYFKDVVDNQVTCDVFPGRMWVDTALSIDVTSIDNTKSDNKIPTVDPVEIPTVEETTTPEKEETIPGPLSYGPNVIPSMPDVVRDTVVEFEIKGTSGKNFLLSISNDGRKMLFDQQVTSPDGEISYRSNKIVPRDIVDKTFDKYIPKYILDAVDEYIEQDKIINEELRTPPEVKKRLAILRDTILGKSVNLVEDIYSKEDELELEDPFSDEEDEDYRLTRTKVNERVRVENSANSQEKETTTEQAEVKETTTSEEEIGEEDFVDLYEDAEEGIEDELEADCIFTNNLIS